MKKLMRRGNLTEEGILKKILTGSGPSLSRRAAQTVTLGVGDDAALFRPNAGLETILTCDWFLEGTHFLRDKHPPDSVGWKCLARALSDVAAMGGRPRCFLLSLALPATHASRWLHQFLRGLRRASRKFDCVLAGGDTTRRNEILINVMVVGEVRKGHAALRSRAHPGDVLYVSGRLGEAELGLRIIRRGKGPARNNSLTSKHLYPEPRLALGQWLSDHQLATAMIDLSDGLSSDLPRLCAASGVGARIETAKFPLVQGSPEIQRLGISSLLLALHGGDDYELLFTVSHDKAAELPRTFQGLALTPIGKITRRRELVQVDHIGRQRQLQAGGWDPFRTPR